MLPDIETARERVPRSTMARPQEFDTAEALYKAMDVFWRKGYEATSLADLLDATGLSKSSLYATFGGKREFFLAAFDAYRQGRAAEMHRILGHGPARQAIERFFRTLFADVATPGPLRGCMSINQAVEMAPQDASIRERVIGDLQYIQAALTQEVERGRADGSIAATRDPAELGRLLVLGFPGLQVMARAGFPPQELEHALALLLSHLD